MATLIVVEAVVSATTISVVEAAARLSRISAVVVVAGVVSSF